MTIASGSIITESNRDAWLRDRSLSLGASEWATAVGLSPYQTPLDLYCRKLGLSPPVEENLAMRLGTLLEPIISLLYQEDSGITIPQERHQIHVRSAIHPFLTATLDAVDSEGNIQEFKTMGSRSSAELGDEGSDEIPPHWITQAMGQLFVAETSRLPDCNFRRVGFSVLVGGQQFRRFVVERDDRLIDMMLPKLEAFWGRVERREPPPVSMASDSHLMHYLNPDPGPSIPGDASLRDLISKYKEFGSDEKEAKDKKDYHKTLILEAMGEASLATFDDGSKVSRKVIEISESVITRKACSYSQIYVSKGKS